MVLALLDRSLINKIHRTLCVIHLSLFKNCLFQRYLHVMFINNLQSRAFGHHCIHVHDSSSWAYCVALSNFAVQAHYQSKRSPLVPG